EGTNDQIAEMSRVLGHSFDSYTVPISLKPPNSQEIPDSPNAINVPVTLSGNVPKVRIRLPNGSEVQCVFDTGASYNIVIPRIAREYNLSAEDGAIIVLPQLDILGCNPPLS